MEPRELPPLWALDMAAKAAGLIDWGDAYSRMGGASAIIASIIAHARTLAKYETPPVDPAELKRWKDAREAAAWANPSEADSYKDGEFDMSLTVRAAYIALCREHRVEPQDKDPGGVA